MAVVNRKNIWCAYASDENGMDMVEKKCTFIKGEKVDGWLYKTDIGNWCVVDEKTGMDTIRYCIYKRKDAIKYFLEAENQTNLYDVMQGEYYSRQVELINKRKMELDIEIEN